MLRDWVDVVAWVVVASEMWRLALGRISQRRAEWHMSVATMEATRSPPGYAWDSG